MYVCVQSIISQNFATTKVLEPNWNDRKKAFCPFHIHSAVDSIILFFHITAIFILYSLYNSFMFSSPLMYIFNNIAKTHQKVTVALYVSCELGDLVKN